MPIFCVKSVSLSPESFFFRFISPTSIIDLHFSCSISFFTTPGEHFYFPTSSDTERVQLVNSLSLVIRIFYFRFVFQYFLLSVCIWIFSTFHLFWISSTFYLNLTNLPKILSLLRHLISGVVCHSKTQIMLSAPFLQFMITRSWLLLKQLLNMS